MRDLCDYETEKTAMLDTLFAVRDPKVLVSGPSKIPKPEPMDVDLGESVDIDMGTEDVDIPIRPHETVEHPLSRQIDFPASDDWNFERPKNWADAMDDSRTVRFNDNVEVHVVPNLFNTYSLSPRSFVLGKKGMLIALTRHHGPFTGVLKSEIKEHRRRMSKTCRWSLRSRHRRAILDVLTSELVERVNMYMSVPLSVAITKPKSKAGPKRKGARATKKLEQLQSTSHILVPEEATAYRGLSARGNYLSSDRPDVSYSKKELCRAFARPNQTSFLKLKRTARYLKTHGRLVYHFPWGDTSRPDEDYIKVFVDTDFAGCAQTRRSTIGGIILYHGHCVKHWSVTGKSVKPVSPLLFVNWE